MKNSDKDSVIKNNKKDTDIEITFEDAAHANSVDEKVATGKSSESNDFAMKPRDTIILTVVLVVIAVIVLIFYMIKQNGSYVEITVNGEVYGKYSLSEEQEIPIRDSDGNVTNTAEIKDGKVFMIEATCPDKLCIKQGKKSDANSEIVCLPNKVVISVKSGDGSVDVDTVVQ